MKEQSNNNDSPDGHGIERIGMELERLAQMLECVDLDAVTRFEIGEQIQRMREILN